MAGKPRTRTHTREGHKKKKNTWTMIESLRYEMKLVVLVANNSAATSRSIEVTILLEWSSSSGCETPNRAMFDSTCTG